MREHIGVVARQCLEFVRRGDEGQLGHLGDLGSEQLGKLRMGVQPGADRGAALGELIEPVQRLLDPLHAVRNLRRVAAELLAEGQRCRVLQMGAADLENVLERLCLVLQRLIELRQRWVEPVGELERRRDMHGGREGIVGGLAEIDVIVGMDRVLGAELAAEELACPVGDHLVQIHVRLRARAGLPHEQREMRIVPAFDHLVGCRHDSLGQALVDQSELDIGESRGLLDHRQSPDQRLRHFLLADPEIPARALGLRPPIAVCGNVDGTERIGLHARWGCSLWTVRSVLAYGHTYVSVSAAIRQARVTRLHDLSARPWLGYNIATGWENAFIAADF